MLKKMSIKKIMISSLAVLMLLIIYLIPDNRKEIELSNSNGSTIKAIHVKYANENAVKDSCAAANGYFTSFSTYFYCSCEKYQ